MSPSYEYGGDREWAFSTRPEFTSAQVDVYQASVAGDGVPLVPGKPTVSRVYTHWSPPRRVHALAQVREIPARVTVRSGSGSPIYTPKKTTIKRPDLFTADEKKNAKNSTNFFNWRPIGSGPMSLDAKIELLDERDQPVAEFNSPAMVLERWGLAKKLTLDYYFVTIDADYERLCRQGLDANCQRSCERPGSEGIEACVAQCVSSSLPRCRSSMESIYGVEEDLRQVARSPAARAMIAEGTIFTTQNFPVVGTTVINNSGRSLNFAPTQLPEGFNLLEQTAQDLFSAAEASSADVIVGVVPDGFLPGYRGYVEGLGSPEKRVVLLNASRGNARVVAHEFGHFYRLKHCPNEAKAKKPCPPPEPIIKGFRVDPSGSSGMNKYEFNQEASDLWPLMAHGGVGDGNPKGYFIKMADYKELFHRIATAPSRGQASAGSLVHRRDHPFVLAGMLAPRLALAQDRPTPTLIVSGTVYDGGIRLDRIRPAIMHHPPDPTTSGSLTMELLDTRGAIMESVSFSATPPDPWHGDPGSPSLFRLHVSAPSGLAAVLVRDAHGLEATRERSPSSPTVAANLTARADGSRTLTWSASDADGDEVVADVFVRADESGWQGAAIDTPKTELTLEPWELPAGERVTARVIISDGFNTASTEVDLGPGRPISILTTIPADGATDVETTLDVIAWVSNPMIETEELVARLPSGSFTLTDPDGGEVFADVAYQPGTGVVTLTPVEPLLPDTSYTATIEGLEDLWGNRLPEPVSWSFTTRSAEQPAPPAPASTEPEPVE